MTKQVLLPYDNPSLLDRLLDLALSTADDMSAEVVLLRVTPFSNKLAHPANTGRLYSELKALQAKLQGKQVPIKIRTMSGSMSEAVAHYAGTMGEDLIVLQGGPN